MDQEISRALFHTVSEYDAEDQNPPKGLGTPAAPQANGMESENSSKAQRYIIESYYALSR